MCTWLNFETTFIWSFEVGYAPCSKHRRRRRRLCRAAHHPSCLRPAMWSYYRYFASQPKRIHQIRGRSCQSEYLSSRLNPRFLKFLYPRDEHSHHTIYGSRARMCHSMCFTIQTMRNIVFWLIKSPCWIASCIRIPSLRIARGCRCFRLLSFQKDCVSVSYDCLILLAATIQWLRQFSLQMHIKLSFVFRIVKSPVGGHLLLNHVYFISHLHQTI